MIIVIAIILALILFVLAPELVVALIKVAFYLAIAGAILAGLVLAGIAILG